MYVCACMCWWVGAVDERNLYLIFFSFVFYLQNATHSRRWDRGRHQTCGSHFQPHCCVALLLPLWHSTWRSCAFYNVSFYFIFNLLPLNAICRRLKIFTLAYLNIRSVDMHRGVSRYSFSRCVCAVWRHYCSMTFAYLSRILVGVFRSKGAWCLLFYCTL